MVLQGLRWSVLGYPLNMGLLFASQVLAARLLSPRDFGAYALGFSIVTIVALVLQLGLPLSLLRRASAAATRGDPAEARHEILSAFVVGAAAAGACVAVLGSPAGRAMLEAAFPRTVLASVAFLLAVRSGLRIVEAITPEVLRAFRDFVRVTIYDGLLTNTVLALALGVVLVTDSRVSLESFMVISVVVSATTLIPALAAVRAKLRATAGAGLQFRNPFEPAMWVSTIGRVVLAQLDMLVVGALGTGRQVALYAVPFRLSLLAGLPLLAVNQVVSPLIAGWHASGASRRLERTTRGTAALALAGALVLAVGFVVAGRALLGGLFGPEYREAYTVLLILGAGQVAQTLTGSCGLALMMTGQHRAYSLVLGVSTVVTVVLDVVLYRAFGIEGLAVATASSLALQNLVQAEMVRRLAGFSTIADPRALVSETMALLARRRARRADAAQRQS